MEETAIRTLSRDPALLLKATAPRVVRGFLDRERLQLSRLEVDGAHVTVLLAPAGFGKTSQLNQWRREVLARGGLAFWYTLDSRDDPLRLVSGLTRSAQSTCGKLGFADPVVEWIEARDDAQEAMTGWLAEIAELSVEVLLLLDDTHLLPTPARREVLSYLLGNAPANLHIALAARPTGALVASGTLSTAKVTHVTASDLRFRPDETLTVLSAAMGSGGDVEAGVHLHELIEGWPLGVQLAVAALKRGGDLEGLLGAATADIRRYFVDAVIDRQPADAINMLIRLADFDVIHADLCPAVLERSDLAQELLRLRDETPLLLQAEDSDWMRMHPLAREILRERLNHLPKEERLAMSQRACAWYVGHGLYEEAAHHAFIAGDVETAISLVERSSHQMTAQGRSAAVLAWYQRLRPDELQQRPGFWAPVAWALAMSDRHAEAQPLIDLILAQPELAIGARFEANLIAGVAAIFADRTDRLAAILEKWPEPPPEARPDETPVHCNLKAFLALYRGQPDQARLESSRIANLDRTQAYSPVSYAFADYITGLSYLWEGRCALAHQELRPALIRAEERLGRCHPVTCLLAALLAHANWECGRSADIAGLLAGRLAMLKRHGLPDAVISAYTVLARIADQEGRQDQALDFLESLYAIGQAQAMPRLQATAQLELVRLHARRGRTETVLELNAQLDTLLRDHCAQIRETSLIPWADLLADLGRAYALLAKDNTPSIAGALEAAESAAALAASMKRGRDAVESRLLRAEALRRQGSGDASAVRAEGMSLALAGGMLQLLREAGERAEVVGVRSSVAPDRSEPSPALTAKQQQVRATALLTAKEREILSLLSGNLSNKEIALAMDLSEDTIKWHMKNLLSKLNAGSRKHALARARQLGLFED
ncbi:hypothetical protein D8I24_2193 (plasmid) [Cupriavidus necator H850]|nr:hypothetical protein D8I24_2193 [Cupriavidus necator H850]